MQAYEKITFDSDAGVAVVTLNNLKSLNAFSQQMRHDLMAANF